jgi:hypothetical protein
VHHASGGHRLYPAHPRVVNWLLKTLFPDRISPKLKPLSFAAWCDDNNIKLERLYDTPLHLRGASVVANDVRYLQLGELSVLQPDERGTSAFTLEG